MSDIISTLKKLQALAQRGVGGERTNAQMFLERFMREHDITESMLENPDRSVHSFCVAKVKETIFIQCVVSVIGNDFTCRESRRGKHYYFIECTESEYIEIEYKLKWYWKEWKKEQRLFLHAFILRNELVSPRPEDCGKDWSELTEKEKDEIRRINEMQRSIHNDKHHKALTK